MATSAKHRLIAAGFAVIAASRADRWLAPLARGLGAILMFHHVRPQVPRAFAPNALLEITPEHLDATLGLIRPLGLDIVPLDEVPDRLARRKGGFVALTFDDGYRDNRDHAAPILERHGAPWTLFVTTGFASGEGRLWWVELEEAIRVLDHLILDGPEGPRELTAQTPQEKSAAFSEAYRVLRSGPEEILRETIAAWCREAGIDGPALTRRLCLDWDELAALAQRPGLTIGAHTLTHPMLAKHDEAVARREIAESRRLIAERLGREVRHFAYPVGDRGSAGPRDFALATKAGFATAVTTRPGHLFAGHAEHPTALPRVSVNGLYQSDAAMRALLSGVPFLAWNGGRRVDVGA